MLSSPGGVSAHIHLTTAARLDAQQWLELQGLITIQWDNVKAFAQKQMKVLDVNHDGTLDAKDAQVALSRFEGFMATTVPSSAGFAAGFAMGMR